MAIDRGLLAFLEAKPGKGDELAAFLEQGRALAAEEDGTVTWYAFRLSETTYGGRSSLVAEGDCEDAAGEDRADGDGAAGSSGGCSVDDEQAASSSRNARMPVRRPGRDPMPPRISTGFPPETATSRR